MAMDFKQLGKGSLIELNTEEGVIQFTFLRTLMDYKHNKLEIIGEVTEEFEEYDDMELEVRGNEIILDLFGDIILVKSLRVVQDSGKGPSNFSCITYQQFQQCQKIGVPMFVNYKYEDTPVLKKEEHQYVQTSSTKGDYIPDELAYLADSEPQIIISSDHFMYL